MTRAPPRFPLPLAVQRTFLTPSAPGITSPASGLQAIHSMNASRSSSRQIALAYVVNVAVSITVNIVLLYI